MIFLKYPGREDRPGRPSRRMGRTRPFGAASAGESERIHVIDEQEVPYSEARHPPGPQGIRRSDAMVMAEILDDRNFLLAPDVLAFKAWSGCRLAAEFRAVLTGYRSGISSGSGTNFVRRALSHGRSS